MKCKKLVRKFDEECGNLEAELDGVSKKEKKRKRKMRMKIKQFI